MDSNLSPGIKIKAIIQKMNAKVAEKKRKKETKAPVNKTWLLKQVDEGPIIPLVSQYAVLLQEVEIPQDEFQVILDILQRIQAILRQVCPNAEVMIFRHHYLQLRDVVSVSSPVNRLSVYLSDKNYQPLLDLSAKTLQSLFSGSSLTALESNGEDINEAELSLKDNSSDYRIGVFTSGKQKAEVITCELLKSLLKFDPRAKSLLILIRYWAIENSVTLAEEGAPRWQTSTLFTNQNVQVEVTSEPTALDWMLMFYLGKEKIIPMPLEVIRLQNKSYEDASFPFFEVQENLIQEWRASRDSPREGSKEYILNVLQLASGFFAYFTISNFRGVVLKTKDVVKHVVPGFKIPEKLYLTQPWASTRCFSVCQTKFENVAQPKMKRTLRKLEFYLKNVGQKKSMKKEPTLYQEVDLKRLFILEKLDVIYYAPLHVDLKEMIERAEEELETENRNIMSIDCGCAGTSVCVDKTSVVHFFTTLYKEIVVSENELAKVEELQKRLASVYPSYQLILFRNGHLKLKTDWSDDGLIDLFFFVDCPGLYSEDETGTRRVELRNEIPLELIDTIKTLGDYSEDGNDNLCVFHFDEAPFKVHIATASFLPEVQASRLVQYLTTFDPRVKPLMTIVFYWAKVNNIPLNTGAQNSDFYSAPASSLLEWMVVTFLCTMGIIPSPDEVCTRRSDGKVMFDGLNIGFKVDPQYAREWRARYSKTNEKQNILNVLELAHQFFHYWTSYSGYWQEHPKILDLKQCRWFHKNELDKDNLDLSDVDSFSDATGIAIETLKVIRSNPDIRQRLYSKQEKLTILHPLHVKYGFAVSCDSVCSKMGVTEDNLKIMLKASKTRIQGKKQKICFEVERFFSVNLK